MNFKNLRDLLISLSIVLLCSQSKMVYANTIMDTSIKIIQLPIHYGKERINLSLDYLKNRHGINQSSPIITPKIIVLHYTEGGTIKSMHNYFNPATIENARQLNKKASTLNVSSQYLVDRDGKIYQLMPDTLFARHAIGINYCAIGVENIGGEHNPLTEAQVTSNANLVRYLCKKYKIEYLVGHAEYIVFRNTPIWKETDPKYITFKGDPGERFMEEVRALTRDLKLKSKP